MAREVVVLSGVATPIGGYGGTLEGHSPQRPGRAVCARGSQPGQGEPRQLATS